MMITEILIVVGVPKNMYKRIEWSRNKAEKRPSKQPQSAGILRKVLENWRDMLVLKLQKKTTSENLCEKLPLSVVIKSH